MSGDQGRNAESINQLLSSNVKLYYWILKICRYHAICVRSRRLHPNGHWKPYAGNSWCTLCLFANFNLSYMHPKSTISNKIDFDFKVISFFFIMAVGWSTFWIEPKHKIRVAIPPRAFTSVSYPLAHPLPVRLAEGPTDHLFSNIKFAFVAVRAKDFYRD